MPELKPSKFQKFTNRLFDPGELTNENIRRNRDMADALLNQVSNPGMIQSPTQGLAVLAQALNAQAFRQRAEKGESALKQQEAQKLGQFLGGLDLDPGREALLRNAPDSVQDQLLGSVAAQQFEPPERINPFAKINPKDFTTESVARFQQTGDFSTLQRVDSGTDSLREQKIRDETERLRRLGFERPEERATAVVDGVIRIGRDTVTGLPQLEDRGTGQVIEIGVQRGPRGEAPVTPQDETLWELAQKATGLIPTTKAGASQVSGAFGGPISKETVEARQVFNAAQNNVIRAFSLNPRYPVAEQKRILENISIEPRAFDNTELMRSRMRGIDQFLRNELATIEFNSELPGLDKAQRSAEEQTARSIRSFLNQLGVPEEAKPSGAPEGVPQQLWDAMTPEEQSLWQN